MAELAADEQVDHHDRGGGNYQDKDGDGKISYQEAVGDDGNPVRLPPPRAAHREQLLGARS